MSICYQCCKEITFGELEKEYDRKTFHLECFGIYVQRLIDNLEVRRKDLLQNLGDK